jgi:hypothetical protein
MGELGIVKQAGEAAGSRSQLILSFVSPAFGVIRSLRCAVICCRRTRTEGRFYILDLRLQICEGIEQRA